MESAKKGIRATYLSIAGNSCLAVLKFVTGILGNSWALIADAIESTADIFSSLLVLFGFHFASKPADKNHPYGHGRIEPLITFIVVVFLVLSAVVIAYESIKNIRTPHELPERYTLVVLGIVIVVKEIIYRIVKKRSVEINSSALKADAFHHRSDAITSLAAFVGISVAIYLGKGYEAADDWAALLASGFILYNSYLIFRPALGEILDEHFYDELVLEIRARSAEVPGVLDTEKCHVRKSGLHYFVDLHITVDGNVSVHAGHEIAHVLKDHLLETVPQLTDVLIHVEPDYI
jgi:cation diffusion facilitator family transporter